MRNKFKGKYIKFFYIKNMAEDEIVIMRSDSLPVILSKNQTVIFW